MNRKLLLAILLLTGSLGLTAQTEVCQPDPAYADSTAGIYPAPYHDSLNPTGGIDIPACRNAYWEFVFTAIVPDSILAPPPLPPVMVPLDSFKIETTGAVLGLPNNFSYACNPPDCVIPKGQTGCLKIFGITDSPVGEYDIQVKVKIYSLLTPMGFEIAVPDDPEQGFFPGRYTIRVLEEGSSECVTRTAERPTELLRATLSPNPAFATTQIEVQTSKAGIYQLQLSDLAGRVLQTYRLYLPEGRSQHPLDLRDLPSGMYLWTLHDGQHGRSGKLVIAR